MNDSRDDHDGDRSDHPRVWLVAEISGDDEPIDRPAVRDDLMRRWTPVEGNLYRIASGRHCATWAELHARFDLVEIA